MSKMQDGSKKRGNNFTIAVRLRPENEIERSGSYRRITSVLDQHVLCFDPEDRRTKHKGPFSRRAKDLKFAFDRVFDEVAAQHEVYEHTAKPLIKHVVNGFNATVFCYGATGSGKTHTMVGNENAGPGVMMLTMIDLFKTIEELKDEAHFRVTLSYLEIYNEVIKDLLNPAHDNCDIREDPEKGICVSDLTAYELESADMMVQYLKKGNSNRSISPTEANAVSSRSHAVLQVLIERTEVASSESTQKRYSKLSLVDLAGSERAARTKNRGQRLVEGGNINRSLLALSNCINALARRGKKKSVHVPYRNSKLTRLLKDSLGGNTLTCMIANISPSSYSYDDTHNTLQYANKAKNIRVKIKQNIKGVKFHVSKYKQVIAEQKQQIRTLKQQVNELKTEVEQLRSNQIISVGQQFENTTTVGEYNKQRKEIFNMMHSEIRRLMSKMQVTKESQFSAKVRLQSLAEDIRDKKRRMLRYRDKNPRVKLEDTPVKLHGLQIQIRNHEVEQEGLKKSQKKLEAQYNELTAEFSVLQEDIQRKVSDSDDKAKLSAEIALRATSLDLDEATRIARFNTQELRIKRKQMKDAMKIFPQLGKLISHQHRLLTRNGLSTEELDREFDIADRICNDAFEEGWQEYASKLYRQSPSHKLRSPSLKRHLKKAMLDETRVRIPPKEETFVMEEEKVQKSLFNNEKQVKELHVNLDRNTSRKSSNLSVKSEFDDDFKEVPHAPHLEHRKLQKIVKPASPAPRMKRKHRIPKSKMMQQHKPQTLNLSLDSIMKEEKPIQSKSSNYGLTTMDRRFADLEDLYKKLQK
ncbi:hypothetical protein PCE1_000079 [Barthelona sp. PCE]